MEIRTDLALMSEWIIEGSHVLDLGCGDGTLLAYLRETRKITGYGLEIDDDNIINCIKAGINVIHADLNEGLLNFPDNSFDYVMMTQAIQTIHSPDKLLMDMLRVGRQGIVTFPNFAYWRARLSFLFKGVMPSSRALPNEWYNTENIHLCTVRDFEKLCDKLDIEVLQRSVVDMEHHAQRRMGWLPNWFGEIALYQLRSKPVKRITSKT
jgi:methionine biosynthesis protein MetW